MSEQREQALDVQLLAEVVRLRKTAESLYKLLTLVFTIVAVAVVLAGALALALSASS